MGILDSEIGEFIPIVSTFRIFNDINLFYISYNRKMLCNGLCQYKNEKNFLYHTPSYIDIDENKLNNPKAINIENIIYQDIFENYSKLCDEPECFIHKKFILNINYENINLPFILTFNININEYNILSNYKTKIDNIFLETVKIKMNSYKLVGIIFNENDNHFICLSKNLNSILNLSDEVWLFHNDLNGKLDILDKGLLAYKNYRNNKIPCMFIYLLNN